MEKILTLEKKRKNSFVFYSLNRIFATKIYKNEVNSYP